MSTLQIRARVTPLPLSRVAKSALQNLESYDWVLFTSQNAVEIFAKILIKKKIPATLRVAAVGPMTAAALRSRGYAVHAVPETHTVASMIKSLGKVSGKRILFPRSALAPEVAPRALRARGASVRVIPLYTAHVPPLSRATRKKLLQGFYDTLEFSSPSGITGLLSQFSSSERRHLLQLRAICIGPTTAEAAKLAGFTDIRIKSV